MNRGQLTPYIFLSFLIHAGFLTAAHNYLRLPAEQVASADLIPVEIDVLGEEISAAAPKTANREQQLTKRASETKSRTPMHSDISRHLGDIGAPVARKDRYEPSMAAETAPTLGAVASVPNGETTTGGPMVAALKTPSVHVSPADPVSPRIPTPSAVYMPTVLIEENAAVRPVSSGLPKKIALPLAGSGSGVILAPEPPLVTKTAHQEPSLSVEAVPTLGAVPEARKGERADGKPMSAALKTTALDVSPAGPAPPQLPSPRQVKVQIDLTEAAADARAALAGTTEKSKAPLAAAPPDIEPDSELHLSATAAHQEPSLAVDTVPILGIAPEARKGERTDGMPMVPVLKTLALHVSPADPASPQLPSPRQVKVQIDLTEAAADARAALAGSTEMSKETLMAAPPDIEPDSELLLSAKAAHHEPSLAVDTVPILGVAPKMRIVEKPDGMPMIAALKPAAFHVSPANPSPPRLPPPMAAKIPANLIEAKAVADPTFSGLPEKTGTTLAGIRYHVEIVSEPLSIPPPASPSISGKREMIRAAAVDSASGRFTTSATKKRSTASSSVQSYLRPAIDAEPADDIRPVSPHNKTAEPDLNVLLSFPFHGLAEGAVYLFAADISGRESASGAFLEVKTQPGGARLYVDDRLIGNTPLNFQLPSGKHEVRLALTGYHGWEAQIEIVEGIQPYYRLIPLFQIEGKKQ